MLRLFLAEVTIDLPPMSFAEMAALFGVLAVLLPMIGTLLVLALSQIFVRKSTFWNALAKHSETHEKHLGLIQEVRNIATQSDSKTHDLLRSIKALTGQLDEHKQATKDNTTATNKLTTEVEILKATREDL